CLREGTFNQHADAIGFFSQHARQSSGRGPVTTNLRQSFRPKQSHGERVEEIAFIHLVGPHDRSPPNAHAVADPGLDPPPPHAGADERAFTYATAAKDE